MKISSYLEFKRDSAKGIFDHRKNPLLLIIDQQLQVYEKVEKVASNEFEEQIVVITILCACNNFLESKPHGSKRSLAVEKIKYQALYRLQEIDQLKDQHRVKAQKNWDKLRTIFKGKGARLGKSTGQKLLLHTLLVFIPALLLKNGILALLMKTL